MIWWLVFNLIFWIGGWTILVIVLIEVVARVFESLWWLVALPLAVVLVVALPGLFVLPVWLDWTAEAYRAARDGRRQQ